MRPVRVVRGAAMPKGPESQSVTRKSTRVGEVSVGEARNGPQTTTGWHHHGDHTAYVYV